MVVDGKKISVEGKVECKNNVINQPIYIANSKFPISKFSGDIKIPDNIPLVGGRSVNAQFDDLPMQCIVTMSGLVLMGVNLDIEPLKNPTTGEIEFERWKTIEDEE